MSAVFSADARAGNTSAPTVVLQDLCIKLVQTGLKYAAKGELESEIAALGHTVNKGLIISAAKVFDTFQRAAVTIYSSGSSR